MNPIKNKKDLEATIDEIRNLCLYISRKIQSIKTTIKNFFV